MVDSVVWGWFGGGMKSMLFCLFAITFMVGCGQEAGKDQVGQKEPHGKSTTDLNGKSKRGQTLNLNISLSFASVIRMSECHASSGLSILGRFIM